MITVSCVSVLLLLEAVLLIIDGHHTEGSLLTTSAKLYKHCMPVIRKAVCTSVVA